MLARRGDDGAGGLRVLYLGRFDRQKGIEEVAGIFSALEVTGRGIRLTVAGGQVVDGDTAVRFSGTTVNLGPLRDSAAVTAALADADILVLPSRYEGLPLVVLEAQRLGVVPIASDLGAVGEAIAQDETGFIVPLAEAVAVTVARILDLDADRARLRAMSEAAAASSRNWNQAVRPLLRYLASQSRSRAGPAGRSAPGPAGTPQRGGTPEHELLEHTEHVTDR